MSATPTISVRDATEESLRTIGVIVCMHVQLEWAMHRFIDALVASMGMPERNDFITRHRFRRPMRILGTLVRAHYANEPMKLRKFRSWRHRINALQIRRNTIIHGSWIDEHGGLRFFRAPRFIHDRATERCTGVTAESLSKDIQLLRMDITAIKAWTHTHRQQD